MSGRTFKAVLATLLVGGAALCGTACVTLVHAPEPRDMRGLRGVPLAAGPRQANGAEVGASESATWLQTSGVLPPAAPSPTPPAPPLRTPPASASPPLSSPSSQPRAPIRLPTPPLAPWRAPATPTLQPLAFPIPFWGQVALWVLLPATAEAPERIAGHAPDSTPQALPAAEGEGAAPEEVNLKELVREHKQALQADFLEWEAQGVRGRLSGTMPELERQRPVEERPPPGVSAQDSHWRQYTEYYAERLEELAGRKAPARKGARPKPPQTWEEYRRTQQLFLKGQDFEQAFADALWEDCQRPQAERRWAQGMQQPGMARNLGLEHEPDGALTYADQALWDRATIQPGMTPHVETFSTKSRDFTGLSKDQINVQVTVDSKEAQRKYDGEVEIRRLGHPLFGQKVRISKPHLVYDAKDMTPDIMKAILAAGKRNGIQIHFYVP